MAGLAPYWGGGVPRMEPGSPMCKAGAFPIVLSFQPQSVSRKKIRTCHLSGPLVSKSESCDQIQAEAETTSTDRENEVGYRRRLQQRQKQKAGCAQKQLPTPVRMEPSESKSLKCSQCQSQSLQCKWHLSSNTF